jgi:hypothetical protein
MVQFGCHKRGKFLFLLQSFRTHIRVFETTDVASHIPDYRNEPLRKQGLTGQEAVTNILSEINAATYNAAHVGTGKTRTAAVGPFTGLSFIAGAGPFIDDRFGFSIIIPSHST